jgi:hypothetical protein
VLSIFALIAQSGEAWTGYVNSYKDWRALSDYGRQMYAMALFDSFSLVGFEPSAAAMAVGVEACGGALRPTGEMLEQAISAHYGSAS